MKQYIDKSSLVEALNKNIRSITRLLDLSKERELDIHLLSKVHAYEDMLDFVNALEVKEISQHEENTCKGNDDSLTSENKHLELKAGKWYICYHAYCCRADSLTVREGERFMCEKDGVVKGFVIKDAEKYFKECSASAPMENEGKISLKLSKEDEEEFKIAIETLHEAGQYASALWLKSIKQRIVQ